MIIFLIKKVLSNCHVSDHKVIMSAFQGLHKFRKYHTCHCKENYLNGMSQTYGDAKEKFHDKYEVQYHDDHEYVEIFCYYIGHKRDRRELLSLCEVYRIVLSMSASSLVTLSLLTVA